MIRSLFLSSQAERQTIIAWFLAISASVVTVPNQSLSGETFLFHHEQVLGTSLELRISADRATSAAAAEAAALDEIDRLTRVFSTYDPDSEFSRWQAESAEWRPVSAELLEVLSASDVWREATGSAFHPGAQSLSQIWKQAEATGELPSVEALSSAVRELRHTPWELDVSRGAARRVATYPLTLNAIAKGFIIDRACARLLEVPGVSAGLVKIGGDLRVRGELEQPVAIRNPGGAAYQTEPLRIEVRDRGVATSGNAYRGFTIQVQTFSHILDPRTGQPVDHIVSATVVAATAMDADALATAFSVMSPRDSLQLARSLGTVDCLLIDGDGRRYTTDGWQRLEVASPSQHQFLAQNPPRTRTAEAEPTEGESGRARQPTPDWNGGYELEVQFEIHNAGGGRRYRRPYIAVWIEDADGFPVRTLALWVQRTGRGPRWIPDLKRWSKSDHVRKFNDETDLIATISEPTRKPGEYALVWDGTDDQGELVEPGDYTVSIESAREHGTYQLIRKKVSVGNQPFREKLAGNPEIKAASLEYRKRSTDK